MGWHIKEIPRLNENFVCHFSSGLPQKHIAENEKKNDTKPNSPTQQYT